jgi:hypothetical protein
MSLASQAQGKQSNKHLTIKHTQFHAMLESVCSALGFAQHAAASLDP